MNPLVRNPPRNRGYFSRSGRAFSIEKYNTSRSGYLSKFHQVLRLPRKVTLELHQVLRLPRKVTLDLHQVLRLPRKVPLDFHQVLRLSRKVTLDLHQVLPLPHRMTPMLDPRHIWNVIYNARSNKCHSPNSPNTAPATQNHHPTSSRNLMKTAEASFPMRGRSEHDPRPFRPWTRQSATRPATEVTFRAQDEHFLLKNTTLRAPAIFPSFTKYCACHEKWHLNFTKYCACHEKWHLTFTKYCACHEKWHLTFTKYCACHEKWHLTFTKYCACHTEWLACLILVTYETSFTMRGATNVTLQTHQILRLPRKITTQHLAEIWWKQLKRHFQCAADPSMIRDRSDHEPVSPQPAAQQRLLFALRTSIFYWKIQRFALRLSFQISPSTAPATKSDTWTSPSTAPATKSDTWPSPSTAPVTKSDTWPSPSTAPATTEWLACLILVTFTITAPATITKWLYYLTLLLLSDSSTWLYYYSAILLLDSTITQRFYYLTLLLLMRFYYLTLLLLSDSITWLYYYSAILLLDSTITQRFYYLTQRFYYLTLLLLSDSITWLSDSITWLYYSPSDSITWLYYYSAILLLDSTITQRFYYLTLLLLSDSITWLYYYSAILLLDCYYYSAILLLDSTITQRFYYLTLLLLSDSITWLY